MPKTTKPVVSDIAKRANVSMATVDRVLNRRPGVREITAKAVLKAAVEVGYIPESDVIKSLQPKRRKVVFLIPSGGNRYLQLLGDTVKQLASSQSNHVKIQCFFVESFNPDLLAKALINYGTKADGIAFMAIEHPLVREAVAQLTSKGKPVVSIVSDMSNSRRSAYVGLDNRAVGRTAAHFLGRIIKASTGKIALIAASRAYKTHEERELGFLVMMEEAFQQYDIIGVREGHDNQDENYQHAVNLLEQYPDLVGIYNVGGSSDGIARALKEYSRDSDIIFIGHGLTQDTRSFLIDGIMDMVITQSPEVIIGNALQIFSNIAQAKEATVGVPRLSMEIMVRENLP